MLLLNIAISILFFRQIGFIVIPIATTLSTWIGVLYYLYLLLKIGYLKIEPDFYINSMKIVFSSSIMTYVFHNSLYYFAKNLSYSSDYKILYLLFIVIFIGFIVFFDLLFFKKYLI